MPDPLYTSSNCSNPAYQLDWSYDLFWRESPPDEDWWDEPQDACSGDGIRLLQHRFREPSVSQFLVSTQVGVSPARIVQRVKGRLQYLIRGQAPRAFRRNYGIRSIGSTRRNKLEHYLATQLAHHRMADCRVQSRLKQYQIHQADVDLSQPRSTTHARYWYNLHIVIVNGSRHMQVQGEVLVRLREMILRVSNAKHHWLSRAAIVPDHIHLTLGCRLEESPKDVALSYMNNLAYACEMKPVFKFGYYVGTFSGLDRNLAIPTRSASEEMP